MTLTSPSSLIAQLREHPPRAAQGFRQMTSARGRYYLSPEGEKLPSVTTILSVIGKPALVNWAARTERELVTEAAARLYEDAPAHPKMARAAFLATLAERIGKTKAFQREQQKALDVGTAAHKLIEWNIQRELGREAGPEPVMRPESAVAFVAYERWRQSVALVPIWSEQMIYHPDEKYAGTMDLFALANMNGKGPAARCLIDFKTSKAIYPEAYLQLAAYACAIEAMGHGHVDRAIVVRLPKTAGDPGFEARDVGDLGGHYRAFLTAKALWQWTNEMAGEYGIDLSTTEGSAA